MPLLPPPCPPDTTSIAEISRAAQQFDGVRELKRDGRDPLRVLADASAGYKATGQWTGNLRELRILLFLSAKTVHTTPADFPGNAPTDLQALYDAVRAHWTESAGQLDVVDAAIYKYAAQLQELLNAPPRAFSADLGKWIPKDAGLYHIVKNDDGSSVYVGVATDLRSRVVQCHYRGTAGTSALRKALLKAHKCPNEEGVTRFLEEGCSVQFIKRTFERERTRLEHFAVAVLNPAFNV